MKSDWTDQSMEQNKKPCAYMSLVRADIQNSRTNTCIDTSGSAWEASHPPASMCQKRPF